MSESIILYIDAFKQLASISAILGGLAFTGAATLLNAGTGTKNPGALNRSAKLMIALAMLSAVFLVSSALMWSFMAADMSRAIANDKINSAIQLIQINYITSLSLIAGIILFFSSIGVSGWIASRKLGITTTIFAIIGGIYFLLMIYFFVTW